MSWCFIAALVNGHQADRGNWPTRPVWLGWRPRKITALNGSGASPGDWPLGVAEAVAFGGLAEEGRGTGERLPDRAAR